VRPRVSDQFKVSTYLGGGPVLTVLFVARAHQPILWVDLRVDGLHQLTLNIQSAQQERAVFVRDGRLWDSYDTSQPSYSLDC
jgi:hypothetical protein